MLLLGTFYTEREGPVVAAFFGYCEILLSASGLVLMTFISTVHFRFGFDDIYIGYPLPVQF